MEVLQGKTVAWITAPVIPMMSQGLMNKVRMVRDNVRVVAVFSSEQDPLYPIMRDNELFHEAVFADLSSADCGKLIVESLSGIKIDGVFSPYEQCQPVVGSVASLLGFDANPVDAYSVARSKHRTREATKRANLATPRSGTAVNHEQLERTLEHVGYPCILKPTSGAGSSGVFRATTHEEAVKAFDNIISEVKKDANLNWNPGCDDNCCLVEQLLVGDEFDVDILMRNGKPVYVQTVDNWPCLEPHFLETGSNLPSTYPKEKLALIEEYAVACLKACGFKHGCFHVELMWDTNENGPVLIEVNARQGGGCMQEFNLEIFGVDVFAQFFLCCMGENIDPKPYETPKCAMADYSFTCPITGTLKDIDFIDQVKENPNVVRCTAFKKAGDFVNGLDCKEKLPMWLGEMVVKGNTPEECKETVDSILQNIRINIQPTPLAPELDGEAAKVNYN